MVVIGQAQIFLVAIVIGAIAGARRGWMREVITCAMMLTTVLFLSLGGGDLIAGLFTHGFGGTASAHPLASPPIPYAPLSGGGGGSGSLPVGTSSGSGPSSPADCSFGLMGQFISNAIFAGMTWISYRVGSRYGKPPTNSNHRLAGMLPGAVNGAAIMFFLSRTIFHGQDIVLMSPTGVSARGTFSVVIALGFLALFALLVIAAIARRPAK